MTESVPKSSTAILSDLIMTRPTKVLHVDDDPDYLKVAEQCLKRQGKFQVDTARSAEEAMEMMEKETYDAIVSDYQMPGKDGLEFLKELRENGNDIPFIIFTGKGREEVVIKALNLGADHFVNKNGDPETVYAELKHAISETVRIRKAESELQESQMRYRNLIENAPDVVYTISENGTLASLNSAFERLTDWKCSEWVGKSFASLVHPDDLNTAMETFEKTLRGECLPPYELRVLSKSGKYLIGEFTSRPWFEKGKIVGEFGIVRDITGRKKAEEALEQSEEKYRNLIENSKDSVVTIDLRGNVQFANKATEELTGYTMEEGIGMNVRKITPLRYWPKSLAMLFQAKEGRPIPYFESAIKRKDGRLVPVESAGQAIIRNGKVVGIQIITRDISERKKTEEALRGSEEKWRSLAENAPNIILVVDRDGTIQFINRTVVDARPEEIVGKSIYDFIDPEHHDVVKKTIEQVFQTGEGGRYEISGVGPKGNVSWYETHVGPIKRNGQVASVTLITTDFTERKKGEHALLESQQKFERLFRGIPEATAFVDVNDCVLDLNPRFSQLFGYSVDEAKGKPLDDLIVPNDKKKEAKMLTENSKEGYVLFETVRKTKDGSLVSVSISAAPISVEGQHVGDVVLYQDITGRKQTEEALRKSEEKFRNLFDRANDAIMYLDRYGRILDVNGRTVEMFGGTREELIGKHFAKIGIFSIKETPMLMRNFADVLAGKKVNLNVSIKNKKGQEIDLECSVSLVKTDEFAGIVVIARDISERQKAEKELRNSEERLNILFELAPDAYYLNDLKGNFIDGNKAAEEVTGYTKNELVGKSFLKLKLLSRSQALKAAKLLAMNALGKPTGPDEFVLSRKDGTQVPVEIRTYPVKIKDKTLVLGIARDITIRKKDEKTIRESQQKFAGLFSHNPEATVYLDSDFRILDVNPRFCQLFGYSAKEVEGKQINEAVAPEDMIEEAESLDKDAKKGYASRDTVRKRKDGSLVRVSVSAAPVTIEDKLLGYVAVYKDITNLVEANEEKDKIARKLEERNRGLGFLYRISKLVEKPNVSLEEILQASVNILPSAWQYPEITCARLGLENKECRTANFKGTRWKQQADIKVYGKTVGSLEVYYLEQRPSSYEGPFSMEERKLLDAAAERLGRIVEREDAEEKIREVNKRLEITNEKLHVVGGLTRHDVRNKLSAVTGNAYLLRRKLAEDPKALEQLSDMEAAIRMVERIFEFARAYEKLGVEQLAYMDVGKAVDEALSLFSDLKGVKIVNECDGLTVLADSLLTQLVYNLVDNSLKHGEKARQIKTYYRTPSADQLELVYEDDGVGIPNNMRSSLFKEGFTSGKGTGYGLFMIKRMSEVYGWTIQETGKQGKGAQFAMLIPRIGSTGKANYQIQKPRQH